MKKPNSKIIEILLCVTLFMMIAIYISNPSIMKYLYECNRAEISQQKPLAVLNDQTLVWWDNIGDCGVGGASGATGGAARWIGRGVSGGLIDMEILSHKSIGNDFVYENLNSKISFNISELYTVNVAIPFTTKNGNYIIGETTQNETVGGLGNLNIGFTQKFGKTNSGDIIVQVGIPTGKYNHRRAPIGFPGSSTIYVVPELQTGNGLYSVSLGTQYTIDKDWGKIIVGGSYSAMTANFKDLFNSNRHWGASNDLFSDANLKSNKDFSGYQDDPNKYNVLFYAPARYEYKDSKDFITDSIAYVAGLAAYANKGDVTLTHQYYTQDQNSNRTDERITGDFYGDVVNVFVAVGLVQESCVHSIAVDYSCKFSTDWYVRSNYGETIQNDYLGLIRKHYLTKILRDNTMQLWNVSYGLEISSLNFPIFLAGTLTLNGAGTVQAYTGTIGVKGSFF